MSAPALRYGLKGEIHNVRPQEAKKKKNRSYSMEAEGADFSNYAERPIRN